MRAAVPWLPTLAIGLATAFLFLPVLIGGESFFGRDVAPFFYPMKHFLAESFDNGRFPLWNPWSAGGGPFFATLQPGVLYPGSLFLLVLPFPHSADSIVILHFVLAGAGWFVLLRHWGRSTPAATFGALAFILGGFFLSIANFLNNLQTVAWAPWLFLAWARYLTHGSAGRLAAFSALCAVAFLGGEPQLLSLILGLVLAHGLLKLGPVAPSRSRQLGSYALAGGLAIATVGVQLVPFMEFIGQSVRALPLEMSFTSSRSLEPAGLAHLFIPPPFEAGLHDFTTQYIGYRNVPWLLSVYPGVVIIAFWLRGLQGEDRRTSWFWGSLAFLGIALALGRYSPLYRVLFEFIPPFRAFRYPEKFMVLLALGLPVLSAIGFDRWREEGVTGGMTSRFLVVLLGAYGLAAGVLLGMPGLLGSLCDASAPGVLLCEDPMIAARLYRDRLVILVVVLATAWIVVRLRASGALRVESAGWALIALAALDLGLAHRSINPSAESELYTTAPWAAEVLASRRDRPDEFRFRGTPVVAAMGSTVQVRGARELSNMYLDLQTMGPNAGQLFGFLQQDGLQGVELQSVAMTHDAAINGWARDPVRYLQAMNVRYYADATAHADSMDGLIEIARHPELPIRLFEVPDPLPRAFVVSNWQLADGPGSSLQRVLETDISLREEVVLERSPVSVADDASRDVDKGLVLAATWENERVHLIAESSEPALLVLLDRWYP
ncbi:MAG: hypothetical protein E4H28_07270, partial [Gemmatimonadales bacterium]